MMTAVGGITPLVEEALRRACSTRALSGSQGIIQVLHVRFPLGTWISLI
jgi:hypothetical protein